MKNLISVSNKFLTISPSELVSLILSSKYTKGIEVSIDFESEFKKNYLNDLVLEMKKNNLILQIHGHIEQQYDEQLEYMKQLEKYSDYLGYPIIVTLHTIFDEDKEKSLIKTRNFLEKFLNEIDNEKLVISLENLNDTKKYARLGKEDITSTILNNENLFFTYDIGHEIADFGNITDVNSLLIEKIRNAHIHSYDNHGRDHQPIYKDDPYWNEIIKGLRYLINIKYQYNIVYEYALEYCNGETVKDKIIDYLNSIDFVSKQYYEE